MKFCTNCGEKINSSSGFCRICGTRVTKAQNNLPSPPLSRIEKRKIRSKTKGIKLVAAVGLLLVICIAIFVIINFKHRPSSNVAAIKTIDQMKNTKVENSVEANKASNTTEEQNKKSSNDYILSDSDKKVISLDDIDNLSKEILRLARNEIYARHGYVFKSDDLQRYFSSKTWYHRDPSYNGLLNTIELENIKTIKAREDSL